MAVEESCLVGGKRRKDSETAECTELLEEPKMHGFLEAIKSRKKQLLTWVDPESDSSSGSGSDDEDVTWVRLCSLLVLSGSPPWGAIPWVPSLHILLVWLLSHFVKIVGKFRGKTFKHVAFSFLSAVGFSTTLQ